VSCAACDHADHLPGPCADCATANTTCWQSIKLAGGDGDRTATGDIEMATGLETRPCATCRHWDGVDKQRIVRHFMSRGLEPQSDGTFKTPIAKDFPGRRSLVLDPRNFGYCRKDTICTDALATCEKWQPTQNLADFQRRMR
jgi:hypothetical protein